MVGTKWDVTEMKAVHHWLVGVQPWFSGPMIPSVTSGHFVSKQGVCSNYLQYTKIIHPEYG